MGNYCYSLRDSSEYVKLIITEMFLFLERNTALLCTIMFQFISLLIVHEGKGLGIFVSLESEFTEFNG